MGQQTKTRARRPRRQLAESEAIRVRAETLGPAWGVPVDVEAIARMLDILIVREVLEEGTYGMFVRKAGREIIFIDNVTETPFRSRFTIAHELGHAVLHAGERVFVDFARNRNSASGEEAYEIEANAFAAELLMPADKIRDEMGDQTLSLFGLQYAAPAPIRDLARRYKVSSAAMQFRLQDLGLFEA